MKKTDKEKITEIMKAADDFPSEIFQRWPELLNPPATIAKKHQALIDQLVKDSYRDKQAWEACRFLLDQFPIYEHPLPVRLTDFATWEAMKQSASNRKQHAKACKPRSKDRAEIITRLALKKDNIGDYLKPRELWSEFYSELESLGMEIKETGNPNLPETWVIINATEEGGGKPYYRFTSFRSKISAARTEARKKHLS